MITITVCKDCQERHSACWGSCEKYQEERRKFNEEKYNRIKQRKAESTVKGVMFENKRRTKEQLTRYSR